MADVIIESIYTVRLTDREFRLVGLALSGKLKGTDIAEARSLNLKMLSVRDAYVKQIGQATSGALEKARAELDVEMAAHRETQTRIEVSE